MGSGGRLAFDYMPIRYALGSYYFSQGQSSTASLVLPDNVLRAYPLLIPRDCTLTRVGGEVMIAGSAGCTIEFAVYRDNGSNQPGALLADLGFISGNLAAVQELTTAQALPANLYWLAVLSVGGGGALPTVRAVNAPSMIVPVAYTAAPGAGLASIVYQVSGAALPPPDPWPQPYANAGSAMRLFVKVE